MRIKKYYYHLIGLVILAAVISRVDLQKLCFLFSRINLLYFMLISLLIPPVFFIKSLRWRYLLRLQGIDYPLSRSFIAYLGGFYAGIITPGRLGETLKAHYLKNDRGISYAQGLVSVFIDRFFDLYFLIIACWLGFFYFLLKRGHGYAAFAVFSVFLFLLHLFIVNKRLLEKAAHVFYGIAISSLDNRFFGGNFKNLFIHTKKLITLRLTPAFFLSLLAYLVYFFQCYLLSRLANIDISYMIVVFFISSLSLFSMVPITIWGIGTRELSLVYFFSLLNLSSESALAYSFLLFFSFYIISGIFGFIGWQMRDINLERTTTRMSITGKRHD